MTPDLSFPLIRERLAPVELASLFLSNPEEIKKEMGKDTTAQLYIRLMAEVMQTDR